MNNLMRAISAIVLSTWASFASGNDLGQEFTLQGKEPFRTDSCFLYVDQFGVDLSLPRSHQFFAMVRTSFAPDQTIVLVSQPGHGEMRSVDKRGRLTEDLRVLLKAPADEQSLIHASSFRGRSARPWKRFLCGKLKPVVPLPAK